MSTIKTVPIEVVPVLGTVLIVLTLGTAFRLVLKTVPVPEHRARAPSLNRALVIKFMILLLVKECLINKLTINNASLIFTSI